MKRIEGIIPAMITPLTYSGDINTSALRKLTQRMLKAGVDAVFTLGTNGEFFSLSDEQRLLTAQTVIDEVSGRVPVIVGTGAASTSQALFLSKKAQELGADALSVITPYFNKLSQSEISTYYKSIAENSEVPVLLYNIPSRTGNHIEPDTARELALFPNIAGIKDSSGNFDNILSYIEAAKGLDFSVYAGTDSLILKTLLAGGQGAVAATANVLPELVVSIYRSWKAGQIDAAAAAQDKLAAIREFSAKFSIPAAYKAAAELLGIDAGPPVLPSLPLSEGERKELRLLLEGYGL